MPGVGSRVPQMGQKAIVVVAAELRMSWHELQKNLSC
jgi:hypothetical protein